jgi:lipopolysaccharide transport system permease protein
MDAMKRKTWNAGQRSVGAYLIDLWRYRHLAFHLANADLKSRFRRSSLGILWAMIHPLSFALMYSFVLVKFFNADSFADFSVYVLTGMVLWDCLANFAGLGAVSIISGAGYLKQSPMPMLLFPIRTTMTLIIVFLIGVCAIAFYVAVLGQFVPLQAKLSIYWEWLAPLTLALFFLGIPIATIAGFMNVLFRDTQQVIVIATQALWFSSPVFFPRELFETEGLALWGMINPVVALCDIFRAAVIEGQPPSPDSWIVVGSWGCALWILAIIMIAFNDRKCIHGL